MGTLCTVAHLLVYRGNSNSHNIKSSSPAQTARLRFWAVPSQALARLRFLCGEWEALPLLSGLTF